MKYLLISLVVLGLMCSNQPTNASVPNISEDKPMVARNGDLRADELLKIDTVVNKYREKNLIPSYIIFNSEIYDVSFKTELTLYILLLFPEKSKSKIEKLVRLLHQEAKKLNFTYHDSPTAIYIYVYESIDDYEKSKASWRAMLIQDQINQEPKISFMNVKVF